MNKPVPIGYRDFLDLSYISQASFSPDGSSISYILKQPLLEGDNYRSQLYIRQADQVEALHFEQVQNYCWKDRERVILSQPGASAGHTKFVVSDLQSQVLQAFEVPLAGSSIQPLNENEFLCLGRFDNNVLPEGAKPGAVSHLTELPYWGEFGLKYTSQTRKRLGRINLETGDWQFITAPYFEVVQYQVADGKISILGMEYTDKGTRRYSLSLYDIASGELQLLIPQDQMHLFYSAPMGEKVLFCGNYDSPLEPKREDTDFYLLDPATGHAELICEYEHNIGGGNVATDGKMGAGRSSKRVGDRLFFLSTRGDDIGLYSISAAGDLVEEARENGVILGFDIHGDKRLYCAMYGQRPAELYLNHERISWHNDSWLEAHQLSSTDRIDITTGDGYNIHGWVMPPLDYVAGKKYPAILHIHGGPPVIFSDIFFYEHQLWAAEGYFVIFCNPRGSDGRGFDFRNLTAKYGDWDYHSIMDYLDGVLAKTPDIDPKRLGVTGGSYGGYMTNWIVGQTDRFAAAVTQRSISNWVTFEYTAIRGYYHSIYKHATTAGENPKLLWDCSPLKYAERATTPTLVIHADNDHVCSLDQGLTMFAALKTAGCPSEMLVFHDEDHELSRAGRPSNRIRRMQAIVEWMNRYLKPRA